MAVAHKYCHLHPCCDSMMNDDHIALVFVDVSVMYVFFICLQKNILYKLALDGVYKQFMRSEEES